jgi:hypothetical protein
MLTGSMAMTYKNLVEGFDMEYGRMNAQLGSTPNPLIPTVGAGPVIGMARYIDPPTEIVKDGEMILWRVAHIGVDSHAIHFHLFNVQVVNRVDWTNTIKPPYEEELGWKETIRTNPFEDIILAIRPVSMKLPFRIPPSSRLLDPTTPAGSTINFLPVPPPIGLPAVAQTANVMTNFGWEYVWHCHLLGHEENDMMRPLVLTVPPPTAPTLSAVVSFPTTTTARVVLTWVNTDATTIGYELQRATNATFTTGLVTFPTLDGIGTTTYTDNSVAMRVRYYYRVRAFNTADSSAWSNVVNLLTLPAPATFTAVASRITGTTTDRVRLAWTYTGGTVSSFTIQRARNAAFTNGLNTATAGSTTRSLTQTGLSRGRSYYYRIRANIAAGSSAWKNATPFPVVTP